MAGPSSIQISRVDHIGVRVKDLDRALDFYRILGFELHLKDPSDAVAIIRNAHDVEINLVYNANADAGERNILMDVGEKYPGYTHVALRVESIRAAIEALREHGIRITQEVAQHCKPWLVPDQPWEKSISTPIVLFDEGRYRCWYIARLKGETEKSTVDDGRRQKLRIEQAGEVSLLFFSQRVAVLLDIVQQPLTRCRVATRESSTAGGGDGDPPTIAWSG